MPLIVGGLMQACWCAREDQGKTALLTSALASVGLRGKSPGGPVSLYEGARETVRMWVHRFRYRLFLLSCKFSAIIVWAVGEFSAMRR
jgi:hypothetical protein